MIPAVRGTRDILPGDVESWQFVESVARRVLERYGYAEVRTPIIEREELFAKGTGASTDIVLKEMYSFTDKGGERVTLRPEATPGLVRAFVQHGLEEKMAVPKLYCLGPMFRYERPQKGRYRQFHQVDVEAFGVAEPTIDAEMLEMVWSWLGELGISGVELVINSVGCATCRPGFVKALLEGLGEDRARLCEDCQRRTVTNPLRIFDCKVPADQPIIDRLPHAIDFLCEECRAHFDQVTRLLGVYEIPYRISHRLVRGLDYYVRTTFEVLAPQLGAQNALVGGGRYDGLVKDLGGPDRPGIGFAAGLERLVLALPADRIPVVGAPDVYVVALGDPARDIAVRLVADLRHSGIRAESDYEGRSLRSQLKRADRLGARRVAILGEDELARGEVALRNMATGEQQAVPQAELLRFLKGEAPGR